MTKVIIADTSCLIALNNIGLLNILHDIFTTITITDAVSKEYGQAIPEWISISNPSSRKLVEDLKRDLDPGEAESIALAKEIGNSLLIIDEKKGRKIAKSLNLKIIGTLKVLLLAHQYGVIPDLKTVIKLLRNSGFRVSQKIEEEILRLSQIKS